MRKGLAVLLSLLFIAPVLNISSPTQGLKYGSGTALSKIDASFIGETPGDYAGFNIKNVGDVNGDDLDDFIMSAYGNGTHYEGKVYLIFGKGAGWAINTSLRNADASFVGAFPGDNLGYSNAGNVDVNGDGLKDIILGTCNGNISHPLIVIFFGKTTGWGYNVSINDSDVSFLGEGTGGGYLRLSGAGDVNSDGYDDFLASDMHYGKSGYEYGKVYLILGHKNWNDTIKLSEITSTFLGETAGMLTGITLSTAGDVNKDGYDDFIIGALDYSYQISGTWYNEAGKTYLILGKSGNWTTNMSLSKADGSYYGTEDWEESAYSLGGGGDLNGDGYDDFIIGAIGTDPRGTVYIIFGNKTPAKNMSLSKAPATIVGDAYVAYIGTDIAIVGDVNGDGYDDLVISIINAMAYADYCSGISYLFLGKKDGWKVGQDMKNPDATFNGEHPYNYLGSFATSGGGDFNGDGYDDILLGAYSNDDGGTEAGKAYLIFPDKNTPPSSVNNITLYLDNLYKTPATYASERDQVFVQLSGTDGDPLKADVAMVDLTSNSTGNISVRLQLRETGKNTGIYQGSFQIMNVSRSSQGFIRAFFGDDVVATSVDDNSKNASVHIQKFELRPGTTHYNVTEDTKLEVHFWAVNGSATTWSIKEAVPWLSWNATSQNLSGTPDNSNIGDFNAWINITDKFGHRDNKKINISVLNVAPNITTPNVLFAPEGSEYSVDYETDEVGGTITWKLFTNAGWLKIDSTTGVVNGTPNNDNVGTIPVKVSVDDGNGATAFTLFNLTVLNVNSPPTITTKDILKAYEDQLYNVWYQAIDLDANDKGLNWTMKTNATWLNFTADHHLQGTPANADVGSYYVNLTVMDSNLTMDHHNFTLTVINVNDPPVWVDLPSDTNITDLDVYTFDVNATDIDACDVLRYNLTSTPVSTISIDDLTGIISWAHPVEGIYNTRVRVTDGQVNIYYYFKIRVVHVILNIPPEATLGSPVNGSSVDTLDPTLQWNVSDADGDNVTSDLYLSKDRALVERFNLSAGLSIGLKATYFTPLTTLERNATYYWTIVPYDGKAAGSCTNGIWSFTIKQNAKVNHLPKFRTTPSLETSVGTQWTYAPIADDEDLGDLVTLDLIAKPSGMVFAGDILSWTPTAGQIGPQTVKLEATDGKGSTFQEFSITVKPHGTIDHTNHAPIVQPIGQTTVKAGERVSIKVHATDEDGDVLSYGINDTAPAGLTIDPSGQLIWDTKIGDEGKYDISIKVSDGKSLVVLPVHITVEKVEPKKSNGWATDNLKIGGIIAVIAAIAGVSVGVLLYKRRKND